MQTYIKPFKQNNYHTRIMRKVPIITKYYEIKQYQIL